MASPNAAFRRRLEQSQVYGKLEVGDRASWLAHCSKLGEARTRYPEANEVFSDPGDGRKMKDVILERLNDYGMAAGCLFVHAKERLTSEPPSLEFRCKFHDADKGRSHKKGGVKLKDAVVRKDPVTGKIVSDRQLEATDFKYGCEVRYAVSFKRAPNLATKAWIGRWMNERHIETHPFPRDPLAFPEHKAKLQAYQSLQNTGWDLRSAKVPYSKAREIMKAKSAMIVSQKEYYNLLLNSVPKDSRSEDTAIAFCSVFEQHGWKYCLRLNEAVEDRKIVQIFYWCDRQRDLARRFTSSTVLIVDGTFRTNRKGMPLLIATGKSNTEKTFPVAYSWVPEEDAESYAFFYKCMKEEIYQDLLEPTVVLTDLSTGMTRAYDKLKCLPNSELQYCQWHAVEAMLVWFRRSGSYTHQQILELQQLLWSYTNSWNEDTLYLRRKAVLNHLVDTNSRQYFENNWVPREDRLIRCFVKFRANLATYSTQRGEGFNPRIHKVVHHQMRLQEAAKEIIGFTDDFFRDFGIELKRQEAERVIGLNKEVFVQLQGQITHEALKLLRTQWQLLLDSAEKECTTAFTKQHLLPCAHQIKPYFESRNPIPLAIIHRRWWIEANSDWRPQITAPDDEPPLPPTTPLHMPIALDAVVENTIALRDQLKGEAQRRYDDRMRDMMLNLQQFGGRLRHEEVLPLGMPDDRPRATKRLPLANEAFVARIREEEKESLQNMRDERALQYQAECYASQASQDSTIVVRLPTPPPAVAPEPLTPPPTYQAVLAYSPRRRAPTPQPALEFEHPASTAPVQMEGRPKRTWKPTEKVVEAQQAKRRR